MSIKEQIERLLKLQKESEVWETLEKRIATWYKSDTAADLPPHVAQSLKTFCAAQIAKLDSQADVQQPEKARAGQFEERPELPKPPPGKNNNVMEGLPDTTMKDPLKFITKYKTWVGKKVLALDGEGNKVYASVVGAAFPNLVIETQQGTRLPAHPATLELTESE